MYAIKSFGRGILDGRVIQLFPKKTKKRMEKHWQN